MLFSLLTCREAAALLDDYVDRELSSRDIILVERHLKICRKCAQRFAGEAAFVQSLRTKLCRIKAPEGLLDAILAELAASTEDPGETDSNRQ